MKEIDSYKGKGNVHLDVSSGQHPMPFHDVTGQLAARFAGPSGKVLDVGCGMGESVSAAREADPSLRFSVADAYPVCLENATKLFDVEEAILMDEHSFSINSEAPGTYDVVVLSHVLEHTVSPRDAIAECMRVLRPGGHFVLAVPNPVRPDVFLSSIKRRDYVNRGHAFAWDRSHIINFLERILELDVVEYHSDEVKILPRKLVNKVGALANAQLQLTKVVPWLSFSHIAVIRKSETA